MSDDDKLSQSFDAADSESDNEYWEAARRLQQRRKARREARAANKGPDGRVLPSASDVETREFLDEASSSAVSSSGSEYSSSDDGLDAETDEHSSECLSSSADVCEQERLEPEAEHASPVAPRNEAPRTPRPARAPVARGHGTEREKHDRFWAKFRVTQDEARDNLFQALKRRDDSDGPDNDQRSLNAESLITPTDKLFVEDTFCATIDAAINTFPDDANTQVFRLLQCDPNGFVSFEDQYTTLRGPVETQQRMLVDRAMEHVVRQQELAAEVRAYDDETATRPQYEAVDSDHDLTYFDKRARQIDLYSERLQSLTTKLPGLNQINTQQEFVPVQSPTLMRMKQIREERLRRDGLSDVIRAIVDCPVCELDCSARVTSDIAPAEIIQLYAYWSEVCVMTNKEIVWRTMAKMWNTNFVDPFKDRREAPVPRLTPSHMDIHFSECDPTNIVPKLVNDVVVLDEAKQCVKDNGMFTEQRIGGRATGKRTLSRNGCKMFLELDRHLQKTQEKLTNYSINTRLVHGTAVAPLPAMFCQTRYIGLKKFMEAAPKKNESQEANASRVVRGILDTSAR